jgi:hypothetical protein
VVGTCDFHLADALRRKIAQGSPSAAMQFKTSVRASRKGTVVVLTMPKCTPGRNEEGVALLRYAQRTLAARPADPASSWARSRLVFYMSPDRVLESDTDTVASLSQTILAETCAVVVPSFGSLQKCQTSNAARGLGVGLAASCPGQAHSTLFCRNFPTKRPTPLPTKRQTSHPVPEPTMHLTHRPTFDVTERPTQRPWPFPSSHPTLGPSPTAVSPPEPFSGRLDGTQAPTPRGIGSATSAAPSSLAGEFFAGATFRRSGIFMLPVRALEITYVCVLAVAVVVVYLLRHRVKVPNWYDNFFGRRLEPPGAFFRMYKTMPRDQDDSKIGRNFGAFRHMYATHSRSNDENADERKPTYVSTVFGGIYATEPTHQDTSRPDRKAAGPFDAMY